MKQRYQNFFENASEAGLLITAQGRLISANQALAEMLGYKSSREILDTVTDIRELLFTTPECSYNDLSFLHEQIGSVTFELYFKRLDGKKLCGQIRALSHSDEDSGQDIIVCFIMDIGSQRDSEEVVFRNSERFRIVALKCADALFEVNMDEGSIEQFGGEESPFGWLPGVFPRNAKEWEEKIHSDDREETVARWKTDASLGKDSLLRYRLKGKGGVYKHVEERYSLMKIGNKNIWVGALRDVTEQTEMLATLEENQRYLEKENVQLKKGLRDRYRLGEILGKSDAMQKVYELIRRAASCDANVIIYGESGTGKELVANAIHKNSERKSGRFAPVNCAAIPKTLIESEFFGYARGAFTGATKNKPGYFELAEGGTLFLDELGEIDANLQVRLLRVLEGREYMALGGDQVKKPNVRIIGATSRDLQNDVNMGLMREDFFYRMHVIPIFLPPLRKRKGDIPLLLTHFTEKYGAPNAPRLTGDIIEALIKYDWPGNVRELENTLQRYFTLGKLDFLDMIVKNNSSKYLPFSPHKNPKAIDLKSFLSAAEKKYIIELLEENNWHRSKVASILNVTRQTLFRKMTQHGLN